jgi:hypothetical protein
MSSNIQTPLFLAPISSTQGDETSKGLVTLNLDEIFGDCFFTPDGETVFLSETADPNALLPSGEKQPAPIASRLVTSSQQQDEAAVSNFVPFAQGGGIATTGLQNPDARATVMGQGSSSDGVAQPNTSNTLKTATVPYMIQPPQQRHHLQFATPAYSLSKRKHMTLSAAARERRMSDQQKTERRYPIFSFF